MNVFNLLAYSARRYPGMGAIFHGTTQVLTFEELLDRTLRIARFIATKGEIGDRVVILAKNCPEYVELLFAIWAAGRIAVPVNAKLHPLETHQIVVDAGARLVFASRDLADELMRSASAAKPDLITIGSRHYIDLFAYDRIEPIHAAATDVAWLFFTSGTTGRSKGAMLTHRNLTAMQTACIADFGSIESDHSLIHAGPMSHGSGLYALPYIGRGARQVIPASDNFDPLEILDLCDVHPRCAMFLAPTMVKRLREAMLALQRKPKNLEKIIYGGGPMYLEELKQSLAAFGQKFAQLYGQGEAPMTITGLRMRDHAIGDMRVLGSVGWPRSGVEVRVVDSDGTALPDGQTGEIICRGDIVMAGYWNDPDATKVTLRGGWLWTGDMGSMDADGLLTLRDRSKDVIISGGSNIYPREVEEILLKYPSVREVSVIGQRDAEWGEITVAFVVSDNPAPSVRDELDRHCLDHIARFKRPKRYIFVENLPKNAYGKVLKRELAKQLSENF
jgi:acyl-CoA synthetase (AMP-forming)/AMP-acid ligase II